MIHRSVTLQLTSIVPSHEDFWYELHEDPDFCSDSCSWRSSWSRRRCSSLAIVWSISLRWDTIIPFNSWILLLSESAWTSCSWISVLTSARICSFYLSRRFLILSLSMSRLDFCFWHELCSYTGRTVLVCATKDWAGNKLSSWEW